MRAKVKEGTWNTTVDRVHTGIKTHTSEESIELLYNCRLPFVTCWASNSSIVTLASLRVATSSLQVRVTSFELLSDDKSDDVISELFWDERAFKSQTLVAIDGQCNSTQPQISNTHEH